MIGPKVAYKIHQTFFDRKAYVRARVCTSFNKFSLLISFPYLQHSTNIVPIFLHIITHFVFLKFSFGFVLIMLAEINHTHTHTHANPCRFSSCCSATISTPTTFSTHNQPTLDNTQSIDSSRPKMRFYPCASIRFEIRRR